MRYAIVTPVKNEEAFIEKTILSVVSQKTLPAVWIVVNDGSTDRTKEILDGYAARFPWIELVHLGTRRHREAGGEGVVGIGLKRLTLTDYDCVVRMDADMAFDDSYFDLLFKRFRENPKLGIASGVCVVRDGRRLVEETHPEFHTRGALKTYRVACLSEIGGLEPCLGWDTIDEIRAQMLGWETRSFRELRVEHLRKTQTAMGAKRGFVNLGVASYYCGYHPLYLLLRSIRACARPPYVVGGLSMLRGYLGGYWRGAPQVADRALIGFVRRHQLRRLLGLSTVWR